MSRGINTHEHRCEEGLHAHPAAELVKEAKGCNSDTKVIKDGKKANAKSSLNLMSLGAKRGDELTIQTEGEEEEWQRRRWLSSSPRESANSLRQ
jgi:phosphotransferase system HPr (HPr) family protein